jgi:hypothetical protein
MICNDLTCLLNYKGDTDSIVSTIDEDYEGYEDDEDDEDIKSIISSIYDVGLYYFSPLNLCINAFSREMLNNN